MKAKVASLLAVLLLTTTQCMAQKRITVEAESYDISNNLDLQAVASVFGESDNLQEFEMKLNDFDSKISNLDLNNDGEVDYLRVIESSENNIHVVVVQAVLDRDVFQDVATIVVEKNRNRRTYVQVIGDPYLYGTNYIIEPVYVYTPHIFSFFWGSNYYRWNSPYYWGYYPSYYRNRNPYEVNIYLSNVNRHVNHDHRYYYTERYRNDYALKLHDRVSRNDYGKKYPDRTFSDRNKDVRNKQEFDNKRSGGERGITTRPSYQGNEAGRRSTENTSGARTSRGQNDNRNSNSTINTSPNTGSRNTNSTINTNPNTGSRNTNSGVNDRMTQPRTSTPTSTSRGSEINREQRQTETSRPATNSNRETYQTPSSTNSNSGSRNNNAVTRDNNSRNSSATPVVRENNSRPTPTVSQPSSRSTDSKPADRKPAESTRSNDDKTERGSRSSDSNSNRR